MPKGKHGPDLQGGGETLDVRRGPCVETTTLGWKATCDCGIEETVPAIVLDPFGGALTTALVAYKLQRNYIAIEINPEYLELGKTRLEKEKSNYGLLENNSCIVPEPIVELNKNGLFKE